MGFRKLYVRQHILIILIANEIKCKSDLFFVNDIQIIKNICVIENISITYDHKALLCNLNIKKKQNICKKINILNINEANILKFNDQLNNIDLNNIIKDCKNINHVFGNIYAKYEELCQKTLSYKVINLKNKNFRNDKKVKNLLIKKSI